MDAAAARETLEEAGVRGTIEVKHPSTTIYFRARVLTSRQARTIIPAFSHILPSLHQQAEND